MRTGLIALGVIFLVIGIVLYIYPSQTFSTQTTTGQSGPVSSSAMFQVPVEWAYAFAAIGVVFLFFGLVISSPAQVAPVIMPTAVVAPVPVAQTHTIIAGQRGPRGPRGSKGTKGKKGKTQSAKTKTIAKTVEVSVVKNSTRRRYPKEALVTTTTTRTIK